ncbi:hypothetical protein HAZT_HAZT011006 [Hyalella azteca]|uniref:Uncharacterized protein n=1 Tax=Hyalella azteca TaxID=294128 RepID=A0A6A0GT81_HYAAZ|nr:hypothetical protein HAZT_HAZT011006 [Hyalella azteca]
MDDGPCKVDDGPCKMDDGPCKVDDGPCKVDDGPCKVDDGLCFRARRYLCYLRLSELCDKRGLMVADVAPATAHLVQVMPQLQHLKLTIFIQPT